MGKNVSVRLNKVAEQQKSAVSSPELSSIQKPRRNAFENRSELEQGDVGVLERVFKVQL